MLLLPLEVLVLRMPTSYLLLTRLVQMLHKLLLYLLLLPLQSKPSVMLQLRSAKCCLLCQSACFVFPWRHFGLLRSQPTPCEVGERGDESVVRYSFIA